MTKVQKHASELMPKSEEALRILQARAEQLAKEEVTSKENKGISYVRFKLGQNESYGISYQYVHEILRDVKIAKPPCIPNYISGVINWRGSLITVVDLIKFFHPDYSGQSSKFIIVINVNGITLGILANQIVGSECYQLNKLSAPLSSANIANPEYILGLHQSVTAIVNAENLIVGLCQEVKKSVYMKGDVHGN